MNDTEQKLNNQIKPQERPEKKPERSYAVYLIILIIAGLTGLFIYNFLLQPQGNITRIVFSYSDAVSV